MGLKLQLRRSWSSYEGFRIVAACQNWDGCCCFGQKWGRGGGVCSEDLYCWGPGWVAVPQFQHTIHHQQRHSYAEFYNPFSFFSSLSPPLSHSPYFTTAHKSFHPLKYYTPWHVLILTPCVNDWNISTSRITTWNDRVTAQSTWCPSRVMNPRPSQ